jgi:catechol 2,3-dioxygenase-like lactoylglutathione lyase family enzyme
MEPRVSIITLGVDDLDRASSFYEAMGLERHKRFADGVAFFQMGGLILALWPREELARDAGFDYEKPTAAQIEMARAGTKAFTSRVPPNFSGVALAYNTRSPEEVAEVLQRAGKAGGRLIKAATVAFWGGTQGYFEDTEGNLWEVAWNPDFPIDAEGRISLPE